MKYAVPLTSYIVNENSEETEANALKAFIVETTQDPEVTGLKDDNE